MTNDFKYSMYIVIATVGYSLITIFIKYAINIGISPQYFVGLGFFLSAVVFWALSITRKENLKIFSRFIVLCALSDILVFYLQTPALGRVSVSLYNIIFFCYPIFVVLIEKLLYKYKVGFRKILSLTISIIGLFLAIGVFESSVKVDMIGMILSFACGLLNGFYLLSQQEMLKKVPYNVALAYIFSAISIFILILCYLSKSFIVVTSLSGNLLIIAFSVFCLTIPSICMALGLQRIGASKVSIINLFQPLVTIGVAKVLFNDALTPLQLIGCLIVIGGISIITVKVKPSAV